MSEPDTIPCLSLWQPWASLMALGAKANETRSWETLYRGPLAIQAAQMWNSELWRICHTSPFREVLKPCYGFKRLRPRITVGGGRVRMPRGEVVCVVDLVDCVRITRENAPTGNELAFGDYTPGRFMWITKNVRRFVEPVPVTGRQGLFRVPRSLLAAELERAVAA